MSGLEFVLSCSIRCSMSVEGVRTPVESLVDTGEESVFAVYPDNQVNGEVTIGGVNSVHHTGFFVHTNLESTSYRQVNFDGFEFNEATVESMPYAIVGSGTSLLPGPTTDVDSIAALLSLSTTILSSQEYTVDCNVTYNDEYTVGETVHELTEKDLVFAISERIFLFN